MTPARAGQLHVLTMVDGIGTQGGAESLACMIAERLDPSRFRRTFCTTRSVPEVEDPASLDRLSEAGVSHLSVPRRSRFDLAPWRVLLRFIRDEGVDILHTHKFGSNLWGSLLTVPSRVPVFIAHEHTWSYSGNRARRLTDRFLIGRRADAFIAVSEQDRRRIIELEGVAPQKVRLIPNGIVLAPGSVGHDVRAEQGIPASAPVIVTVATLRPQKALDVLIRAAALLRDRLPELVVLVVGGEEDGSSQEPARLRALIGELGLERCVRLLGVRDDVYDVLAAADVAALSSDFEGAPLSLLEYMEAAKPVVATSVGGVPDIVEDGVTGLLVPPQDPERLAGALERLLRDPEQATRMGEAGRQRRRTEFDISVTVERIEALYEELHSRKRPSG